MANTANQRTIILHNQETITHKEGSGKRFLKGTDWEYLEAAAKHLKGENFKVYMYFLSWYGAGRVDYSPVDVSNKWGMGVSTARGAIETLIQQGYLVPVKDKNNQYDFYPISTTQV